MADPKIAELAGHPSVKGAAAAIHSAGTTRTHVVDLIAETKSGELSLTGGEQKQYNEILHKFSETRDRANLKTFTDSLRSLNGEDEATRAHVAGALLAHSAKSGRDGISLMADVLVHVHGAQDIQFKANIPDGVDSLTHIDKGKQATLPITELVKHGTLIDSGNLPKWEKGEQDYLQTQIAHAQASAQKLYPAEHAQIAARR